MTGSETQVGQIFISDKRLSRSFVSLLSEKVPETNAELYSLVEIPVLNPNAWAEYDRMAKLIQSLLRKNFRRPNDNAFENSIAQINDELAKIAAAGQTAWVGKMNACIAVRQNDSLFVSTTGKIHAFLFRDKQFADIADSPSKSNPLKTFENFAIGKVLKKDYLIFTTTQLFNYISIERLKDILSAAPLASACQNIAEIIKNLADETVSFGTFILELSGAKEFTPESILKFSNPIESTALPKVFKTAAAMPLLNKVVPTLKRTWAQIRLFKPTKLNLKDVNPLLMARRAKDLADMEKLKALPKAKKFFLVSASVFAVILIVNIFVAIHVHGKHKAASAVNKIFAEIDQKITDSNSAYIYEDKTKAMQILSEAQAQLATIPDTKATKEQKAKVAAELIALQNSIGGLRTVELKELATYSGSVDQLRSAAGTIYLINHNGNLYVPYKDGLGDDFTVSGNAAAVGSDDNILMFVDTDGKIHSVDADNKNETQQQGFTKLGTGLVFYGSPAKAYTVDNQSNQILVSTVSNSNGPSNYLKQSVDLSGVQDLAIDGSVYILYPDKIRKFVSGNERAFTNPNLKYSAKSKIYANNAWRYVYVMDPEAKRVTVLDKNGNIKTQYTSERFTDMKDMVVDEASKTTYILNGSNLVSFQLSM